AEGSGSPCVPCSPLSRWLLARARTEREGRMPKVELDAETSLAPDRVIAMLTDFSEHRPEVWPGLWEDAYEVYSVGETTAELREGNKSPKVWARERYDWSKPGTVRWEV